MWRSSLPGCVWLCGEGLISVKAVIGLYTLMHMKKLFTKSCKTRKQHKCHSFNLNEQPKQCPQNLKAYQSESSRILRSTLYRQKSLWHSSPGSGSAKDGRSCQASMPAEIQSPNMNNCFTRRPSYYGTLVASRSNQDIVGRNQLRHSKGINPHRFPKGTHVFVWWQKN